MTATHEWLTWREATQRALYDDGGFYRRGPGPADHFRTSVHATPLFAEVVLALARSADLRTVVDVGSGRGELLHALRALDPSLSLVAVELAERPAKLPAEIEWRHVLPEPAELRDALAIGNEWLDNVPVDAVELSRKGWRLLLVDPSSGAERTGDVVGGADLAWLDRWWPSPEIGDRAEIGMPRDEAWSAVLHSLTRGIAVAVDYHHVRGKRPRAGSLAGYRGGNRVAPLPDGTCDITSHVALDACAAAGAAAGAEWTVLTEQRPVVQAVHGEAAPPTYDMAVGDPVAYLAALSRTSHLAELTRRDGLGAFGWLVQGVGVEVPAQLNPGAARELPRPATGADPA